MKKINEVKIQNLTFKQKNKVILNKINLNLRKDFIVGITGDSGTGKSTFARILAGLEKGYSGRIKFYKDKNYYCIIIYHRAYFNHTSRCFCF